MLETVRAYAALELTASGHRDDALEGLARYWTGEASRAAEGWSDPRRPSGWIACVTIWKYRGALAWLIECGRPSGQPTSPGG